MSDVLRLAIVDPIESTRNVLKTTLLNVESVWLEAECSRYDFFSDVVAQSCPDVGIVSLDSDADRAVELIERLTEENPACALIVTSSNNDGQLILRSIRAGAKEYVASPIAVPDLCAALDRIKRQRGNSVKKKSTTGRVIAVCGASGGVGTTSIAVNLATVLAQDKTKNVVLIDLDLALGDMDVFLDTIPTHTIMDVLQDVSRLDLPMLKRSLTKHHSGVHLLPHPVHLADLENVQPGDLTQVISLLKASFSHIVIDTSKSYSQLDMAAFREADDIVLITQLDLPCLRNTVRVLLSLEEMKLGDRVRVVVNRVGLESGQISLKKARETIGRDVYWQIPNDYGVMIEVRNNGVPLVQQAPKAAITQSFRQFAEKITGEQKVETEEAKNAKKSWLSFLQK